MFFAKLAKAILGVVMAVSILAWQPGQTKQVAFSTVEAAPSVTSVQSFESARIAIRRLRDGRIVSNPNSTYPNDRVARGEGYAVEVTYQTDAIRPPGTVTIPEYYDAKVITRVNGVVRAERFFKATGFETFYYWKDTVSTSSSFSNVYFEVYSKTGRLLSSQRLPIGSY